MTLLGLQLTLRAYIRSWRTAYLVEGYWDDNSNLPASAHDRPSLHRED
jgi:hypothetical protein